MFKKSLFSFLILFGTAFQLSGQELDFDQMKVMEVAPASQVCKLPPTDINAHFFVRPGPELLNRIKSKANITFEVDYFSSCSGQEWPQAAINAFEFAMGIWAEHINSPVPIKVNANWMTLDGTVLGSARPTRIVQVPNVGETNTWYTLAQLSAMAGRAIRDQLDEIDYDIDMNIQCNYEDWYFGTDANVPDGKSDFVTVVLHEIGHGIGFLGSMEADVEAQTAEWGLSAENRQPLIYDRFAVDGDFHNLISTSFYPNPSGDLYSALIGERGGVFFDGDDANYTLNEQQANRAKLYTPDPFNEGSSYSHLDQNTFRQTINALMLPFIDRAFAVHSPGPLFCGVLSDMGWPLGDGCLDFIPSSILITENNGINFGVLNEGETSGFSLILTNRTDAELTLNGTLEVNHENFVIPGDNSFSIQPGTSKEIAIQYNPEENARHTGRLSVFHDAKNLHSPLTISMEGESLNTGQIVRLDQSYPNPFVVANVHNMDRPIIEYAISQDSEVMLDLFTVSGQHLQSLVNDLKETGRYREFVDMNGLSSGIYIYRIVVDGVAKSGKLMYVR